MDYNNLNQNESNADSVDNFGASSHVDVNNTFNEDVNQTNSNLNSMQQDSELNNASNFNSDYNVNSSTKEFSNNLNTNNLNTSNFKKDNLKGNNIGKGKKVGSKNSIAMIAMIISIIAIAITAYLLFAFIKQNKNLDKLNAEVNGITKNFDNRTLEIEKRLRTIEDIKKDLEKNKKEEKDEKEDKSLNIKIAENVLNEIGRDYKKDPKQFADDNEQLDQKKFENKFLKNPEIEKMNKDGKWTVETEGATIRFIYQFKDSKYLKYNFYLDLTLKAEGNYEVKAVKGTLNKSEKESVDITEKMSGEIDE